MVLAAAEERLNPFKRDPLKTEGPQEEETGPDAKLRAFVQEHRTALQVTGLTALAATTGAVGGLVMAKAVLVGKGTALLGGTGAGKFLAGGTVGLIGGGAIGWRLGHQRAVRRHKQQLRLADAVPEPTPVGAEPDPEPGSPSPAPSTEKSGSELTQIRGVGPVYARRLAQAGIASLSALVTRSPDELRTIVQSPGADSPGWIAQAHALLEPVPEAKVAAQTEERAVLHLDRLEAIEELTPEHAHRLNAAGILTYADLAAQTPEQLRQIVAGNGEQEVPADRWIIEAAQK